MPKMTLSKVFLTVSLFSFVSCAYYEDLVKRFSIKRGNFESGHNEYFRGMDLKTITTMMGGLRRTDWTVPIKPAEMTTAEIPKYFNSAEKWTKCAETITHIKDQSDCGSCWAVAASEVIADRICIGNYETIPDDFGLIDMSAEQILSCCSFCGFGCQGGYTIDAMKFWSLNGVVTGGWYGSSCGCMPYVIPPCNPQCEWPAGQTPNCTHTCRDGYGKEFKMDKHYAKDYYLIPSTVAHLQAEIMANGPIECVFTVYENFMTYKKGVYDKVEGRKLGGHAIKVIGWGESDEGIQYWIINNSWNKTWGIDGPGPDVVSRNRGRVNTGHRNTTVNIRNWNEDKPQTSWNGEFWMLRGSNFCGVESYCVAGTAKPNDNGFELKC